MKTFEELGVSEEIRRAIEELGFENPMPVQEEVIPYLLGNKNDVIDKVTFKRCLDLNDRQLRVINTGLSGESRIVPRVDGFDITAASEIMAILCLSRNIDDLKRRLGNIVIGYNKDGKEVTARDLKAEGAMAVLLHDAILPNLVQTLEGNPAIIHGGIP